VAALLKTLEREVDKDYHLPITPALWVRILDLPNFQANRWTEDRIFPKIISQRHLHLLLIVKVTSKKIVLT
jgi:hypothetical protein